MDLLPCALRQRAPHLTFWVRGTSTECEHQCRDRRARERRALRSYFHRKRSMSKPDSPDPRNPFGVEDAPDPNGPDVDAFAAEVHLIGSPDDPNARPWHSSSGSQQQQDSIEGDWSSRWNGSADPSIAGDAKETWKQGKAEVQVVGERVYMLFDWDNGNRQALIDARRAGPDKLVGRYINLSDPTITRPWVGLIVDNRRIDGRWTNGRLDFQR
jgi:hypothetical protein